MTLLFVSNDIPEQDLIQAMGHIVAVHGEGSPKPVTGLISWVYDYRIVDAINSTGRPLWVGGAWPPYTGPGTRYFEGMMNDGWRWTLLQMNKMAYASYMNQPNHGNQAGWYITEELDLTSLTNVALRQRFEWYLIDLLEDFHGQTFIWSPWGSGYPTSSKILAYQALFTSVINWLWNQYKVKVNLQIHFQDGVGAGHHTEQEAIIWVQKLKSAIPTLPVFINTELFRKNPAGGLTYENQSVLDKRRETYKAAGLALGASWELRYWYPSVGYLANHAES